MEMTGRQTGGPGRSNAVEGGNDVPLRATGQGKTRPVIRGDLIEGLIDWCPDGTYAIYAGFPTDPIVAANVCRIYRYDPNANTLTTIEPTVDCNGAILNPVVNANISVQFLAVKFAPFYSPAVGGYLCYILVRVTHGGVTSTQIWIYNGGTATIIVNAPGAGVGDFALTAGVVNTYDALPGHTSSYFCLPITTASSRPPWTNWDYLSAHTAIGAFRDIGFSWAGDPSAISYGPGETAGPQQIPYGIVAGDGNSYWGAGGVIYDDMVGGPFRNAYSIGFSDGTAQLGPAAADLYRFIPDRSLEYIETWADVSATVGQNHILPLTVAYTPCVPTDLGKAVLANGAGSYILKAYNNTTFTWVLSGSGPWEVNSGSIMTIVNGTGAGISASNAKTITMSALGPPIYVGAAPADIGAAVTIAGAGAFVLESYDNPSRTWKLYGAGPWQILPNTIALGASGCTGLITAVPASYSAKNVVGIFSVTLNAGGYISCVAADVGKYVFDGINVLTLISYDNTNRIWMMSGASTTAAFNLQVIDGVGRGVATAASSDATNIIPKISLYRKGIAMALFNAQIHVPTSQGGDCLNEVLEATGNSSVTFFRQGGAGGTLLGYFGRIRRQTDTDPNGAALPWVGNSGTTFTEIRAPYPNDLRRQSDPIYGNPPTGDPATDRPEYTDLTWGPNRNALWVVGRHGRLINIGNPKWIFAEPTTAPSYTITTQTYPDPNTVNTGIQWSPDGIGFLLTSKTFNSNPANTSGVVPTLEDVSDAFVRNLVTYYAPATGFSKFTLNESKVTGFPFTNLNELGTEHYRYAWHPFGRYSIFSVYGGFEKYDQDLFVDMQGTLAATVNVPQPVNIRIQDGNGASLADVVTDPFGTNRLAVDAYLNTANTPDAPLFTQDEGQMCFEEFNPATSQVGTGLWSTDIETTWITAVTDWSPTTGVSSINDVGPSVATLALRHPIMISRIALTGILNEVSVDVIDVTGVDWRKIDTVTNSDGADSDNFAPMVVKGIVVTANNPVAVHSTIYELAVWKVHEVKPSVPASSPLQVQAQQVVSLDEIHTGLSALTGDTAGTIPDLFDHEMTTGVTFDGIATPNCGVNLYFKSPLMLSRITLSSESATPPDGIPSTVQIYVYDVAGVEHTVYNGMLNNTAPSAPLSGIDTGNFKQQPGSFMSVSPSSPIVAARVKIIDGQIPGFLWTIDEVTLFKTVETKSFVYNEPSEPAFVQDDQLLSVDEVWWPDVVITGNILPAPWEQPLKDTMRKNPSIPVAPITIDAGATIFLPFNAPHLIGRMVLRGTLFADVTIDVHTTNGSVVAVSGPVTLTDYDYLDSGNFVEPVMANGITINGSISAPTEIVQLSIVKVFETKGFMTNDSKVPAHVQAEQQVVLSEIDSITGTGDFVANTYLEDLFDKEISDPTHISYAATDAGTIVITFTHPLLLSRAVLTGDFDADDILKVTYYTSTGTVEVINHTVVGTNETIIDSGNVPDEVVWKVVVDVNAAGDAGGFLDELVLFKVIETKDGASFTPTIIMVNNVTTGLVENASPLLGDAIAPTAPPTFAVPGDLSGHGVRVVAKNVNLELELTTPTLVTTIKGYVDWYWSPDNTLYYYMASTAIDDTAGDDGSGNPNPTGFNAAEDVSYQNIAMPVNGEGKWIDIVVRNTDAANDFTVVNARLVQR